MTARKARTAALAAMLLASVLAAPEARADSCSAGTSATVSRSTGGTCAQAMALNQELTLTYRVRNASIVDSGPNNGTQVQSTIFSGSEIIGTLAQEDSFEGATELPGVLTFIPVCPTGSVGGSLNAGDPCNPALSQCGSGVCGCVSSQPGITCTLSGNPNKVMLDLTQDVVFAGNEQKDMATIRVKVTDLVGAPSVCGLFYTRSTSAGDILVTTDALCDAQLTAGAQASADLHTSECVSNSDCGDTDCNACIENESGNTCQPIHLGSACGQDTNATDCLAPACVDEGGLGVCEQQQNAVNEGGTCDNNDGVPVLAGDCKTPECVAGVCDEGTPLDCDDGVACTLDACNQAGDGCDHTPDDSLCNDDVFCNGDETCDVVDGCEPGTPPDCGDGVPCTTDLCDAATDACDHTPNNSLCSDNMFCNGNETCDVVEGCEPGTPPDCSDAFACTGDSCNEATDSCSHVPDNALCNDGQFCDGTETCSAASGCVAGVPVPCNDAFVCSADSCNEDTDSCDHNFTPCVCGDHEITGSEVCDPPVMAGTFEDCNNGVDDDMDGLVDCRDPGCKPNARGPLCDETCQLDQTCLKFIRDPARIVFNPKDGPDEIYVHGRIPMTGAFERVGRGVIFELSNPFGAIYRAELGEGDMHPGVAGRYFRFRDQDAEILGDSSERVGLSSVRFRTRKFAGVEYIVFTVRAFADLSAANHYLMTTKLSAGPEVGFLTAEWTATPRGWLLHQKDF